jgi:hypothetical protein
MSWLGHGHGGSQENIAWFTSLKATASSSSKLGFIIDFLEGLGAASPIV